jgi:hypothetical protein
MNATERNANRPHLAPARLVDKTWVVGSRPQKVEGVYRQPGELIPEAADWSYKLRNIYLDQGLIEEVDLVTDDAREAFQRQWDAERTARFEAAKAAPAPATWSVPAEKAPAPDLTVQVCANCRKKNSFDHPVADDEWWQCSGCMQRQCGEQSRRGSLQLLNVPGGSHAVNHNHKEPTWRQQ